jgi:rod shape-determining protein MreC
VFEDRRTTRRASKRSGSPRLAGLGSRSASRSRGDSNRPTRSNSLLFFVALLATTLIVVGSTGPFAGVRGVFADLLGPVRSAGSAVFSPVTDFFGSVGSQRDLRRENQRLREENVELSSQVALSDDAMREREELLELNKIDDVRSLPQVVAQVVGGVTSNFDVTIQIDAGSDQGIKVGMPVVAGLSLIGRVTVVTGSSARVRLFTDTSVGVGVRLADSGKLGVIQGRGAGNEIQVALVDPSTKVRKGEYVITSGLATSRFPRGLLVGRVTRAEVVPGQLDQTVVIEPFTELDRIGFVKVLLWTPPELVNLTIPSTIPPSTIPASTVPASSTIGSTDSGASASSVVGSTESGG